MTWILYLTWSNKLILFNYIEKNNASKWNKLKKIDDLYKKNACKKKNEVQFQTNFILNNKI
jgi:hypothetical protein